MEARLMGGLQMFEISHFNHVVRAISVETGWRVLVLERLATPLQYNDYQSSAVYPTAADAIASGVQFIQRQQTLLALWEFLDDCYGSSIITETELDALSASLCLFCSFKDVHSEYGYWYR
ncbi:hypothetical protein H6F86_17110 [Phormidium sp. FACHB-592]|uniref:Uncharacterized protein n=1 Tax=Stenomitos frigidus AS-A4 TaxID=2933935 RepID=A0ABV0KSK5_9CYAN|nr:hypothetical protein [Phormidium sp. FACHB-592]MBD2075583.1 hypothetical protein [Phormidium sp. FACHB-592]